LVHPAVRRMNFILQAHATLDMPRSYIYVCGYAFVLEMVSLRYGLCLWFWSILKFFQVSLILPKMIIYRCLHNVRTRKDVESRIQKARGAFTRLRKIWLHII
jgi:cellulose synthase/poly-beta-1,6-N-acetylglucosamine synthase-like glycosyltransferase